MDIYTIIVMLHVIGTILGAGGATLAELNIATALRDGKVGDEERALMHANYTLIRVGMAILFVSIIAMLWYHLSQGNMFIITSEKLWAKYLMFGAIIVNAVALSRRWVPLWLGASISFTSWWGATLLGLAGRLPYSIEMYLVGYVIAIFVCAGILHMTRKAIIARRFSGLFSLR